MIDTLYVNFHFCHKYVVNWLDHLTPAECLSLLIAAAIVGSVWMANRGENKLG